MADAYYEIAQELRRKPSVQLASKGTQWDRLYIEQRTVNITTRYGRYPHTDCNTLPPECTPGAPHPKCAYLILVDAYITGGDDHKQNWSFTYQLDIRAFAAAFPNTGPWEDMLAKDGLYVTFPAEDDSADITWTFTLVNPDTYTKPTQGTPHPRYPDCLFINETHQRQGQTVTITRAYHKVAPMTAQQKVGWQLVGEYAGYDLLMWTYESPISAYASPPSLTTCPIPGHTNKYVIKPPEVLMVNALNCRVTVTYGRLPGPQITLPMLGEGVAGVVSNHSLRLRPLDVWMPTCLSRQATDANGYSKVVHWTTIDATPKLEGYDYDSTGRVTPYSEQVVDAGEEGESINADGEYATVRPINQFYSIRRDAVDAQISGDVWYEYEQDDETGDLIEIRREIVDADDEPNTDEGELVAQKQITTEHALRVTRILKNPTDYTLRQWVDYEFPEVLLGIDADPRGDGVRVNYRTRSAYRKKTLAEVEVSFHDEMPDAILVYNIQPSGQRYNGLLFNIDVRGMLTDSWPGIGIIGSTTELVDILPSNPTASAYVAAIGTRVPIAEKTDRWWNGMIRREVVYIRLE